MPSRGRGSTVEVISHVTKVKVKESKEGGFVHALGNPRGFTHSINENIIQDSF
jgi:hypothetical protein